MYASDSTDHRRFEFRPSAWGMGALVAGGITVAVWLLAVALCIAPFVFWFAWNVLRFGPAVGLPRLGVWAILLATLFLVLGWFGKVAIAGVVFLIDPTWLHRSATMHWPAPTFRNLLAVALLAALAARPHARRRKSE